MRGKISVALLRIMPCENELPLGLVKAEKSYWAAAYEKMGRQQIEFEAIKSFTRLWKERKPVSTCTCKMGCKRLSCN